LTAQGFEDASDAQSQFTVTHPIKMNDTSGLAIGSVIKYTCSGCTSEGHFEI